MFSCGKSKQENTSSQNETDSLIEKEEIQFKKKNNVFCDIDTLSLNYSIEAENYIDKNIFTKEAFIKDVYSVDSLKFISIRVNPSNFHLKLSLSEKQLNYFKNIKDKNFDNLKVIFRDRFLVFKLINFKKNDSVFVGNGELVDLKDLELL